MGFTRRQVKSGPVPGSEIVIPRTLSGRPVQRPWRADQIVHTVENACETAANCMVFRAGGVSKAPFGATRGGVFDTSHPLSKLFAQPAGVFFSRSDFFHQLMYVLLANSGGCYVVAPLDSKGQPVTLWVRTAKDVRPIPSDTEFISGYQMRRDSSWYDVDPSQYLVWQHRYVPIDTDDQFGSWPPLARAARAVRSFDYLGRFVSELLQNKAMIDGILSNRDPMDLEVAKMAEQRVEEWLNGSGAAGGVKFLPGGLTFQALSASLADVNPGEIEDRLEAQICASFQVNMISVRTHAGMTTSSSLGADKVRQFIRQDFQGTVTSDWTMLAADIGVVLAERYGLAPDEVGFDTSGVKELEEGPDALFTRAKLGTGFLQVAEQRRIVAPAVPGGLEEVPGTDVIPAMQQAAYIASFATPKAASRPMRVKGLTGELLRKATDMTAVAHERSFESSAKACFATERKKVLAKLDSLKASNPKMATKDVFDYADEITAEIDRVAWEAAFKGEIAKALAAGAHLQEIGMDFSLVNPHAIAAIQNRVTKLSGNVTETTVTAIRDAIEQAKVSGETIETLASRISDVFDIADSYRATMIARTESMGAANDGGFVAGKQAQDEGITVEKTWLSMMDERTRDSHLIEETIPMDELFSNGLMYPHDPDADGGEVINCRCSCAYTGAGDVTITAVDEGA